MDFYNIRNLSDEYIYEFLFEQVNVMFNRTDHNLKDGEKGRLFGWYWGYYGRAILDMYRATDDIRFKELFLWAVYRLLEVRDDVLQLQDEERGRVIAGWGTRFKNGKRACEVTTTGLITLPIAEYVALFGSSFLESEVRLMLNEFLTEVEEANEGGFIFHKSDEVVEALNHSHLYGASLAHASRFDKDTDVYKDICKSLLKYFKSFATYSEQNILKWPYSPSPGENRNALPAEALWKAGATIELPIAMKEAALLKPKQKLFDELKNVLRLNPIIQNGQLPQFIDSGKNVQFKEKLKGTSLAGFIASWVQFDDVDLNELIISIVYKNKEFFPNGWLGEIYPEKGGSRTMIMAYAHMRRAFPHMVS